MPESTDQSMNAQELSRSTAYLNLNKIEKINPEIATTLCARDYKGFGTGFNTMNGVIEWKKKRNNGN